MPPETAVRNDVLQINAPGVRWLSSGWGGGIVEAAAAYLMSVPEGWTRTDIDTYVTERISRAGFDEEGPALLTGVDLRHARGARLGDVVVYATVGLSNPAALPMDPTGDRSRTTDESTGAGTVNVVLTTDRALSDAGLATLMGVAVEAKAATLLAVSGVPGTTTDAVIVGSDRRGAEKPFAGSATAVGSAARACVRDAVRASFQSRYPDGSAPDSVVEAEHGVVTNQRATVFSL